MNSKSFDCIIIGGGLSGLTAALLLRRAGKNVLLLEKSAEVGGRARTKVKNGFLLNFGAHALYKNGVAFRILSNLGFTPSGKAPASRGYVVKEGKKELLPGDIFSFCQTKLFSTVGKLKLFRVLWSIHFTDPHQLREYTAAQWLQQLTKDANIIAFLTALIRLTTYTAQIDLLSAKAAAQQLQIALKGGVLYLDGGWQQIVDFLVKGLIEHQVSVITNASILKTQSSINSHDVILADGTKYSAASLIFTCPPKESLRLLGDQANDLYSAGEFVTPSMAACLDIGLKELPDPSTTFAIGIDHPYYFSVHSAWANLAPHGGALVHIIKYLDGHHNDSHEVRRELESFMDFLQPGWRDQVAEIRFLPDITVEYAIKTPDKSKLTLHLVRLAQEGICFAGDWLDDDCLLADASLLSAETAANQVIHAITKQAVPVLS